MITVSIIGIVLVVVAIYVADEVKLRRKSTIELTALVYTGQWARYGAAIKELKRRGVDIAEFEPRLLSLLLSKNLVERGNAYNLVSDHYPALKAKLAGYLSTQTPEVSRAKLPEIFEGIVPVDGHASVIVVKNEEE